MKVKLVMSIVLLFFFSQTVCWALTGREIMDKSDELIIEPDTSKMRSVMYIHKGKRKLEKEFETIMKKFPDGEDKSLTSFIRPTKMKFLMHAHKNKDDDQWLRLSSGKVKRIAGSNKGGAAFNSHFSYEDMGSRNIDDANYKNLGDKKTNGFDCYLVEAVPKDKKDKTYDKTVIYVRKSDFFPIKMDIYKKGALYKTLEMFDIKKIEGINTPHKLVMSLANGKGKTIIEMKSIKYNEKIKNSKFNKEAFR